MVYEIQRYEFVQKTIVAESYTMLVVEFLASNRSSIHLEPIYMILVFEGLKINSV